MSQSAHLALRAVEIRRTCGAFAARKFAVRNNVLSLYRLACQLEAVEKEGA